MPTDRRPLVILKPAPQSRDRIFTPEALRRLRDAFRVVDLEDDPNPDSFTAALPDAFAIIGQPDLRTEVLNAASQLKAIVNVEGNSFQRRLSDRLRQGHPRSRLRWRLLTSSG